MMVGSAGVRKAVMICLLAFVFTVLTGFAVVNYHAKLLLVQARVTDAMDPNLGTILIGTYNIFTWNCAKFLFYMV